MQHPASGPVHGEPKTTVRSVAIKPGKSARLEVGEYPSEDAIPKFSLEYQPDRDLIGQSQARIPTPSGIRVTYHFDNYGQQAATVYVRWDS